MPTWLAYWETEPVASLPYALIMNSSAASRLFSPDPHDRAEISEVGSEFKLHALQITPEGLRGHWRDNMSENFL